MKNRRIGLCFLKTPFILHFISVSLIYVCILILINLYSPWKMITELKNCAQSPSPWWIHCLISQLSFTAVILILLGTMLVLLHRSLGAIPRIEEILEKVSNGDYSLRISVRKKDVIHSFADKLNKVLDLLEEKSKG